MWHGAQAAKPIFRVPRPEGLGLRQVVKKAFFGVSTRVVECDFDRRVILYKAPGGIVRKKVTSHFPKSMLSKQYKRTVRMEQRACPGCH
jgi:hypothetical protein